MYDFSLSPCTIQEEDIRNNLPMNEATLFDYIKKIVATPHCLKKYTQFVLFYIS